MSPCQGHHGHLKMSIMDKMLCQFDRRGREREGEGRQREEKGERGKEGEEERELGGWRERKGFWSPVACDPPEGDCLTCSASQCHVYPVKQLSIRKNSYMYVLSCILS